MLPVYIAIAYYLIFTRVLPGLYNRWKRQKQLSLKKRVILFTRYPVPGTTKTRLIPNLGEAGSAMLQLLMTNHMIDVLRETSKRLKGVCIEVRHCGGDPVQMNYWIGRHCDPMIVYREQIGDDLGHKMANAIKDAFNEGVNTVLIVGSDIPGITTDILEEAMKYLDTNKNTDIVLGPAQDGGYYTIGASIRANKYIHEVFSGIEWGTEKVLKEQIKTIKQLGLKLKILPTVLSDVDNVEDLSVVEEHLSINRNTIKRPHWSIVIPILNEAHNLDTVIRTLIENADSPERLEIIVADGGSTDNPNDVISQLKTEFKSTGSTIKLLTCSQRSRGVQLNEGASIATHELLMFVHADSRVPKHYDSKAWHALLTPGVTAGAFNFGLDVVHVPKKSKTVSWWFLQQMKLLEWGTKWRAIKLELPYGDQGLFLWRETFDKVGGYPPYRLMEDYEMITRLKKGGHIAIVDGPPLLTSARRWIKHGYIKITGINTLLIIAYKCGVQPNTLARWYYGQ